VTATELATAAGIGRSTASKLLATLADQGRVLRQSGGHKDGRLDLDRVSVDTVSIRAPKGGSHRRKSRRPRKAGSKLQLPATTAQASHSWSS
jgi:hypothetical protein